MRTFAVLSITGVTGILLLKLLVTMIFPLLGLLLGLVAMTVKFALIAGVIFFVYSMIRRRKEEQAA